MQAADPASVHHGPSIIGTEDSGCHTCTPEQGQDKGVVKRKNPAKNRSQYSSTRQPN